MIVALLAIGTGLLFLQEPGFGDEFTYWRLGFDLHEIGSHAWSVKSFHALRWPIWGICWLLQGVIGPGLASFYLVPFIYLVGGAAIVFAFGRKVIGSVEAGLMCTLVFLFHPAIDAVISRPMPDLAESVFGGCAVLAWWWMMKADTPRRTALFGVLCGLSIGLAFSTRITGIFIAPVLAVTTLVQYPKRWRRLILPALVAAFYFAAEAAVYHQVCGDWLHSLTANLNNRGVKGTEPVPIWWLPVRFFHGFYHGNHLGPVYTLFCVWGIWAAWRRWGSLGKLLVLWFVILYLEYSCSIQSLHPIRPLIGPTIRYFATVAVPMALLTAIGVLELGSQLNRVPWPPFRTVLQAAVRHPLLATAGVVVALTLLTSRPPFSLGYVQPLRRHLATVPLGTRIISHRPMYVLAALVDADRARSLRWTTPRSLLTPSETSEGDAEGCEQFWYIRKLLWLNERKAGERGETKAQLPLPSYLNTPERDWVLDNVLARGSEPELVFYRRRPAGAAPAHILDAHATEFGTLIPNLPSTWQHQSGKLLERQWTIPASMRGKLVRFEFEGASASVEPLTMKFRFRTGNQLTMEYVFKPITYAGGGKEFVALSIPVNADKCDIRLVLNGGTKEVTLFGFRAVYDEIR